MKKSNLVALALGVITATTAVAGASAHGVFFANRADQKTLVLGEGPTDNAYKASYVKKVLGYNVKGQPVPVQVIDTGKNIAIVEPEGLGTTVTFFDWGHFTKDKAGVLHHDTFENVKDAVKTTHALKYNVHIWSPEATPVRYNNVPIQIVPSVNPMTLHKGDTYEIQVFKDGKPMANAPLIKDVINDLTNESKADENGRATVTVSANGLNVVGVEIGYPTDKPGHQDKYFSSLSFIIEPEED